MDDALLLPKMLVLGLTRRRVADETNELVLVGIGIGIGIGVLLFWRLAACTDRMPRIESSAAADR